jgi:hypothetical protein
LHVILVNADARLLKPTVEITGAGSDLELPGVENLHLCTPALQPFEKGVENQRGVRFFSFWAAIEGKYFHLSFPLVPRTSVSSLSVLTSI